MDSYILDWKEYAALARQTSAEGCVLLRNENAALPLVPGDTVAVFGRIQLDYYKSGTGSGGMVNVPYVHSIPDGLREYEAQNIRIYEPLLAVYQAWAKEHPFDHGNGWGQEPWCQEEMPLSDALVEDAAAHTTAALVILGRTAGEDRDNSGQPGSYYLTDAELDMLRKVCAAFSRTTVVLNTGNIISMNWVDEVRPGAVLYAWQGGMEGGCGVADVLCGAVSPSGRLSDTIARDLDDYPSTKNFGSDTANFYQEDIYVGYRYFETFAPEKVAYPFGFGLSYTTFATEYSVSVNLEAILASSGSELSVSVRPLESLSLACEKRNCPSGSNSGGNPGANSDMPPAQNSRMNFRINSDKNSNVNFDISPDGNVGMDFEENPGAHFTLSATVTNTGGRPGKEVVQVYVCPPQGTLGKPLRNLCAFEKTKELRPGESQTLTMTVALSDLASYDDSGASGHRSCYVLEAGCYFIYAGENVRDAKLTGSFFLPETIVVLQCSEAMAPVIPFERFRPQPSCIQAASSMLACNATSTDISDATSGSTQSIVSDSAQGMTSDTASGTGSFSAQGAVPDFAQDTALASHRELPPHSPLALAYESVPLRTVSPAKRRLKHLPERRSNAQRFPIDRRDLPSPGSTLALRAGYPPSQISGEGRFLIACHIPETKVTSSLM